ncbi:hypothetical protein EG858_15685, partial [Enterococcus faecalis]
AADAEEEEEEEEDGDEDEDRAGGEGREDGGEGPRGAGGGAGESESESSRAEGAPRSAEQQVGVAGVLGLLVVRDGLHLDGPERAAGPAVAAAEADDLHRGRVLPVLAGPPGARGPVGLHGAAGGADAGLEGRK